MSAHTALILSQALSLLNDLVNPSAQRSTPSLSRHKRSAFGAYRNLLNNPAIT